MISYTKVLRKNQYVCTTLRQVEKSWPVSKACSRLPAPCMRRCVCLDLWVCVRSWALFSFWSQRGRVHPGGHAPISPSWRPTCLHFTVRKNPLATPTSHRGPALVPLPPYAPKIPRPHLAVWTQDDQAVALFPHPHFEVPARIFIIATLLPYSKLFISFISFIPKWLTILSKEGKQQFGVKGRS